MQLHPWVRVMLLVAAAYIAISIVAAALDDSPDPHVVRFWRLAAWVACALAGAAHILYEHFRQHSIPRITAAHAAGGVALGAFGVAFAANVHWLLGHAAGEHAPLVALPTFPAVTALPAFFAAWAAAAVLARFSPVDQHV